VEAQGLLELRIAGLTEKISVLLLLPSNTECFVGGEADAISGHGAEVKTPVMPSAV